MTARRTGVRRRVTAGARASRLPRRAAIRRQAATTRTGTPRRIAREAWTVFLDNFSVLHEGWATDIEIRQTKRVSWIEAHDLPHEGVSVDLKAGDATASVIVGNEPDDHLTHIISHTTRITLLNANELEIEAADRSRTIVRCRWTDDR